MMKGEGSEAEKKEGEWRSLRKEKNCKDVECVHDRRTQGAEERLFVVFPECQR